MNSESITPDALLTHFAAREVEMLYALGKLVDMESPSEDLEAIEDIARALQLYVETETGVDTEVIRRGPDHRPHLLTRMGEQTDVLFIGHFDTVYPSGSAREAPCSAASPPPGPRWRASCASCRAGRCGS